MLLVLRVLLVHPLLLLRLLVHALLLRLLRLVVRLVKAPRDAAPHKVQAAAAAAAAASQQRCPAAAAAAAAAADEVVCGLRPVVQVQGLVGLGAAAGVVRGGLLLREPRREGGAAAVKAAR